MPSAYRRLNCVELSFTAAKDGLPYDKGYLGMFEQASLVQLDEISQRSEEAVSRETRNCASPARITV